jgi:hypothetical protein
MKNTLCICVNTSTKLRIVSYFEESGAVNCRVPSIHCQVTNVIFERAIVNRQFSFIVGKNSGIFTVRKYDISKDRSRECQHLENPGTQFDRRSVARVSAVYERNAFILETTRDDNTFYYNRTISRSEERSSSFNVYNSIKWRPALASDSDNSLNTFSVKSSVVYSLL